MTKPKKYILRSDGITLIFDKIIDFLAIPNSLPLGKRNSCKYNLDVGKSGSQLMRQSMLEDVCLNVSLMSWSKARSAEPNMRHEYIASTSPAAPSFLRPVRESHESPNRANTHTPMISFLLHRFTPAFLTFVLLKPEE